MVAIFPPRDCVERNGMPGTKSVFVDFSGLKYVKKN
jgi:hypothetical protein